MGEKDESSGSPRAASTAGDAPPRHRGDKPQVKIMHRLPTFHDPNAMTDREVMEHTGLTSAPEATP